MASAIGHASSTVHRIWHAFGLQPHRAETFKLSSDPWFVEQVRDFALLTERALKRGVYRSVRALEQTIEG